MDIQHPAHAFTVTSHGVEEFDQHASAELHHHRQQARILVADYARHQGLRDPDQLARLASQCVQTADEWLARQVSESELPSLESVSVRIAARTLGLDQPPAAEESPSPTTWVPEGCQRQMPAQPLGELVTAASPTFWKQVLTQFTAFVAIATSKIGL
ncbi:hypothetical protein [Aeoliella straminimaris]|nr:hypothetical protein [Aeoliella straminimaris]